MLPSTSLERETTAFAWGGFGEVYNARFNGSPVVIKTLRLPGAQIDLKKLHRVTGFRFKGTEVISDRIPSSLSMRSSDGNGFGMIISYRSLVFRWILRCFRSYRIEWSMAASWTLSSSNQTSTAWVS